MALRWLWVCSALALVLGVAPRAHAWTSAHVRSVAADIDVQPDGRALVTLALSVDVQGGWLERLDLPGLDEELEVDPERGAWLVTADGAEVPASVKAKAGELSVRFERSSAPRRGQHRLIVRYATQLLGRASENLDDGRVRLRHGLPGWEAGLTEGEMRWLVPAGSRAVADPEVAQELRDEPAAGGRRLLSFVRAHVPRSTPWTVEVDVPGSLFAAPVAAPAVAPRAGRSLATGSVVVLGLLLFGLLARAGLRREARAAGCDVAPALPTGLRRLLRALGALGAACLWPVAVAPAFAAALALVLSFRDRAAPSARPAGLGRFVPLTRAALRQVRRARLGAALGGFAFADPTTALGAALVAAASYAVASHPGAFDVTRDPWGLLASAALVSCALSARALRPRSAIAQAALLRDVAARLLTVGSALRLVWYVPASGAPREPRLRVLPFARYPGLLRVELAVDSRRYAPPLVLMAVVEAGSAADRWLEGTGLVRELSPGALRAVYLGPIDDATEQLDALFAHLAARSQGACVEQVGALPRAA